MEKKTLIDHKDQIIDFVIEQLYSPTISNRSVEVPNIIAAYRQQHLQEIENSNLENVPMRLVEIMVGMDLLKLSSGNVEAAMGMATLTPHGKTIKESGGYLKTIHKQKEAIQTQEIQKVEKGKIEASRFEKQNKLNLAAIIISGLAVIVPLIVSYFNSDTTAIEKLNDRFDRQGKQIDSLVNKYRSVKSEKDSIARLLNKERTKADTTN